MSKIRVLVCEDDPIQLENLLEKLEHIQDVEVVATAKNGHDMLYKTMNDKSIQALIFDYDLGHGCKTGLDMYRRILDRGRLLYGIMITGHGQEIEVGEVYSANLVGYIDKPYELPALKREIKKLLFRFKIEKTFTNPVPVVSNDTFMILEADEILYIETDGKCSAIVTVDDTRYPSSVSIGVYKNFLQQFGFYDVNQSYCVNSKHCSYFDSSTRQIHFVNSPKVAYYSKEKANEIINMLSFKSRSKELVMEFA